MTISNLKKQLVGFGNTVGSTAKDAVQRGLDGANTFQKQARAVKNSVKDLAHRGADAVRAEHETTKSKFEHLVHSGAREVGKQLGPDALAPFDAGKRINDLQPGDTYKLGGGAKVSFEDGTASAAIAATVTREKDGSFTVGFNGDGSGGISNDEGQGVETGAELGLGAHSEYKFQTAADAARAAHILTTGSSSLEDSKFLASHLSAVEYTGNAAAELAAKLKPSPLATSHALGGTVDATARVEFTHPPQLVFKSSLTSSVKNAVGFGGSDAGLKLGVGVATQSLDVKATIEQRYQLPSTNPKDLAHALGDGKASVTLNVGAKANAMGNGGGASAQLKFECPANELERPATMRALALGDYATAVKNLDGATKVTASVKTTTSSGFSASVSGGTSALGAKASLEATTTHSSTVWQYPPPGKSATPSEAIDELSRLPPARKAIGTIKP
jgi:hypothetical protein